VIDYVHLGYASTYEYYTIIEIDNGKFIKELNMNYNQYIEFKDIQFEFFRKTETYKTIFDRIYFNRSLSKFPGHETWLKEDEINNSIKIVLTDYLEKIYE
jgi:tryptophan synthase beta subunit